MHQHNTIMSPFINEPLALGVVSGESLAQVVIHLYCQVSEILKEKTTLMYSKTSEQRTLWGRAICPL